MQSSLKLTFSILEAFLRNALLIIISLMLCRSVNLTHQLSVSISEQVPIDDPSKKAAYVRLILDGVYSLQDGSEASCKYHMVIHGKFMIDKSVPDEDFETKLWFNGSAAVYGIARSKMEVMSSMVLNHGKIELPMVNMYELLKAQFEKENKS